MTELTLEMLRAELAPTHTKPDAVKSALESALESAAALAVDSVADTTVDIVVAITVEWAALVRPMRLTKINSAGLSRTNIEQVPMRTTPMRIAWPGSRVSMEPVAISEWRIANPCSRQAMDQAAAVLALADWREPGSALELAWASALPIDLELRIQLGSMACGEVRFFDGDFKFNSTC